MVFSGIYPVNPEDYEVFRDALERLKLNDAAFCMSLRPHPLSVLGSAVVFWLLHMEIIQERLDREYQVEIITTLPNAV